VPLCKLFNFCFLKICFFLLRDEDSGTPAADEGCVVDGVEQGRLLNRQLQRAAKAVGIGHRLLKQLVKIERTNWEKLLSVVLRN
jgi:hypothetical protein